MTRIITGRGKGRRLQAPAGEHTRPTGARVKQTLFDILAPRLPGCRFLDACAGSGSIGLEALSRGAARVVLVETSAPAVATLRSNAALLADAKAGESFDLVYLDPPYESDLYEPLLLECGGTLLSAGGLVVAEHFHKRALPETIGPLRTVRDVRVGDHRLSFYKRDE